jgi:hypothetical protein
MSVTVEEGAKSASGSAGLEGLVQREHPRIAAPPLIISDLNATVMNVSLGGACIMSNHPLKLGEVYELIATDGVFFYTVELKGRVVWARDGKFGLKWEDARPEQVEWLRDRFDAWKISLGKLKLA